MFLIGTIGAGKALAGLKEYEAALDEFKKILDNDPNIPPALVARGNVYLETNQNDSALVDFQTAAKANRGDMEAMLGYGKALVNLGRADEAVTPLTRVLTADPKNAEALRYRGTAYAGQFKMQKAVEDLQQSIALNPDDHESYSMLGMAYMRAEDYQNAVDQLAKAIEHYKPKVGQEDIPYFQGYLALANAYIELGKKNKDDKAAAKAAYKSASDECEKILKLTDTKNPILAQVRAAALYSRGVSERMQGELIPATKTFTEALELNPELGEAYFRRGICFHMLGEDKMAIIDFERAAHIPPYDDPRFNLWAGLTHAKIGEYHKALRSYGDAIANSDRYTPAYYNRGLTYMQIGDYEKAIADFNEAIRLDPTKGDYYFKRGLALEKQGDPKKAAESFATAIEFDKKHAGAYRHMSGVMAKQGKTELSNQYKQKADELEPPKAKR
jgi:tetratricopeptide (TPR) repeat protein